MTGLDGHAYVGRGDDDDPFIVGITSLKLIDNILKFGSRDRFALFHADATFKLSDIGYPVISCGFTDPSRSYQLAALFIVSRRTSVDYGHCFRSFADNVYQIRGLWLFISAVMGGAEDAQANALIAIPELLGRIC
ncbi:unnamed protein product [Phytophthora fragariaefolia]|uniref:Unnamed protein product n=1 Tax=Phytophthora fragariaefolia TaxID=1490495 RepID=A0A9W7CRD6_9STRA|nr:unnamed protein product [Phytophthora fragariaefolia]